MKETINVSDLMIQNHEYIKRLFEKFKRNLKKNNGRVFESFDIFKWEMEKHLLIEERSVFGFYYSDDGEDYEITLDLIKQHKVILEMLKIIEEDLRNKSAVNILEFEKLWTKHKRFEDEIFYPELDRKLNNHEKKDIAERIVYSIPVN